jgi:4-hydroxy-tetrahydrodipicolinate reductase
MINILLYGCNGRMGQVITQMLKEDKSMKIVAGIDGYLGISNSYPVFSKIEDCDVKVDVVVDFSTAQGIDSLIAYSVAKRLPVVLCTTGLSPKQIQAVEDATQEIPILKAANMSLGINLLLKLVQDATKVLANAGYDIEIVERHHNQKVDAPSGTAIALADSISSVLDEQYSYVYDRSQSRQKRTGKEIGLSAVRGGTIVGEHEVIFAGVDEVFEFKHTAYSRSVFGKGAIEAARFLAGKPPGMYSMGDVVAV